MANDPRQYGALIGSSASFAGHDQGIDFTGRAPVFAIGNGIITRLESSGSGWPGQGALLVYRLISGPGKGRNVYVAEDFAPAGNLHVGGQVHQGQTLGLATGSGQAPGIETGWADAQGFAFGSPVHGVYNPSGYSFDSFVQAISKGQAGHTGGGGVNYGQAVLQGLENGLGVIPGAGAVFGGIHLSGAAPGVNSLARHVPGVAQAEDTAKFLGKLDNPKLWLRGGEMVAGGVLVLVGIVMLGRSASSSGPAQQTVEAAKTTAVPARVVTRQVKVRRNERRAKAGMANAGTTTSKRDPKAFTKSTPGPNQRRLTKKKPVQQRRTTSRAPAGTKDYFGNEIE